MSEIAHRTTRVTDGQDKAIGLFKDQPRFRAVLGSWLAESQEIEDMLWALLQRRIDNPDTGGVTLDAIGDIVGQPRGALADDEYKVFITARIKAHRSSGRLDQLLAILALLTPGEIDAYTFPKSLLFILPDQLMLDPVTLAVQFLGVAKAAGDHLDVVYSVAPRVSTWTLDDASAPHVTVAQSPGDYNAAGSGGHMAAVINAR